MIQLQPRPSYKHFCKTQLAKFPVVARGKKNLLKYVFLEPPKKSFTLTKTVESQYYLFLFSLFACFNTVFLSSEYFNYCTSNDRKKHYFSERYAFFTDCACLLKTFSQERGSCNTGRNKNTINHIHNFLWDEQPYQRNKSANLCFFSTST